MTIRIGPFGAGVLVLVGAVGCGGGSGGETPPAQPTLSIADQAGFEPASGTGTLNLVVTLSPVSNASVTVNYETTDATSTADVDFSSASGTLTFLAGETQKNIAIQLLSDATGDERDETFRVTLSDPSGAILARSQAIATIVDIVVRPDTGITTCANATSNGLTCPQTGFDQQDAESGRDNTHNDGSDGRAGFSFTKLDSGGNDLAAAASSWSCIRDEVTGLIWEIKTNDGGLRDRDNTYAWYNADSTANGGNAGSPTGGTCSGGINCNTSAYLAAVNAAGLCGASDWRIPTTEELLSINDYGTITPPGIDTAYFNDIVISGPLTYWASESDASAPAHAWVVDFAIGSAGNSSVAEKASYPGLVRLVRTP